MHNFIFICYYPVKLDLYPDAPPMQDSLQISSQSVDLIAGEVLYIPPYWMVHSEARETSVFLDVLVVVTFRVFHYFIYNMIVL